MNRVAGFIKTTIMGGVILLLPISLMILLLAKILGSLSTVIAPLVAALPVKSVGGVAVVTILTPVVLILVAFLGGLFLRTRTVTRSIQWLEQALFSRLPGFTVIKQLTSSIAGQLKGDLFAPALVELSDSDAACIAFITEKLASGEFVVLVPMAPTPNVGTIYVLKKDRVKPLDISLAQAIDLVTKWGIGSRSSLEAGR